MNNSLLSLTALTLSFSTLAGIILHATHLDQAVVASAGPVGHHDTLGKNLPSADAHTHVERHSFARSAAYTTSPALAPRSDDKKHLLQRHIPKGHHAFDNYNLPIV